MHANKLQLSVLPAWERPPVFAGCRRAAVSEGGGRDARPGPSVGLSADKPKARETRGKHVHTREPRSSRHPTLTTEAAIRTSSALREENKREKPDELPTAGAAAAGQPTGLPTCNDKASAFHRALS